MDDTNSMIGDNQPPADANPLADRLKEKYQPQLDRRDRLLASAERVPEEVTDEETAKKILRLEKMLSESMKEADLIRKAEKDPFLTAERQVDSWFKAISDPLKKALDAITQRRVKFQAAQRKAEQEARDKAIREAEEAARKAQKAAEAARGPVTTQRAQDAEKLAQEAAQKAALAEQAAAAPVKMRDEIGVSGGFKMEWSGKIIDVTKLDLEKLRPDLAYVDLEKAVSRYAKRTRGAPLTGAEFTEVPKGTRR